MQLLVQNRPMKRGAADDCLVAHLELAAHSRAVPKRGLYVRRFHNAALLLIGDLLVLTALVEVMGLPFKVAAACLAGFAIRRLYPGWGLSWGEELGRQFSTLMVVFGLWTLFAPPADAAVLLALPAALLLLPLLRRAVKHALLASNHFGMPVAIYGAGTDGRNLLETLRSNIDMGLIPIAFLDDHPAYWGAHVQGLPVLGDTNVVLNQAWVGILAMPDVEQGFRQHLLDGPLSCYSYAYDVSDGQHPLSALDGNSYPSLMDRLARYILVKPGS